MHPRYEKPGQFFATRRSHTFEPNGGNSRYIPLLAKYANKLYLQSFENCSKLS